VDLFGVVSFIHDIEIRMSDPVTLSQEFFGVREIMTGCFEIFRPVIICRSVSTETEVFRNRFLVLPVLQE